MQLSVFLSRENLCFYRIGNCSCHRNVYIPEMTSAPSEQFRIYLVRHAHAAWPAPGMRDYDRPLDAAGLEEAAVLAQLIADNNHQPSLVYCSSAVRCQQTLEIILPKLTGSPEVTLHSPLYSENFETYLHLINENAERAPGSIMIIGHNPMLEETAEALLLHDRRGLAEALSEGFPTAGLFVADNVSVSRPATGGYGRFIDLLYPVGA